MAIGIRQAKRLARIWIEALSPSSFTIKETCNTHAAKNIV
jgi:hypothetical protein